MLDRTRIEDQLSAAQDALAAAQAQIDTAQEATAAAEAARDALQQQLDELAAAAAAHNPLQGDLLNAPQIPRPTGSGWSIQESMQVTPVEYAEIQVRTIANNNPSSLSLCVSGSALSAALSSEPLWTGWTTSAVKTQRNSPLFSVRYVPSQI